MLDVEGELAARAESDGVEFFFAMFVDMHGKPCAKMIPVEAIDVRIEKTMDRRTYSRVSAASARTLATTASMSSGLSAGPASTVLSRILVPGHDGRVTVPAIGDDRRVRLSTLRKMGSQDSPEVGAGQEPGTEIIHQVRSLPGQATERAGRRHAPQDDLAARRAIRNDGAVSSQRWPRGAPWLAELRWQGHTSPAVSMIMPHACPRRRCGAGGCR